MGSWQWGHLPFSIAGTVVLLLLPNRRARPPWRRAGLRRDGLLPDDASVPVRGQEVVQVHPAGGGEGLTAEGCVPGEGHAPVSVPGLRLGVDGAVHDATARRTGGGRATRRPVVAAPAGGNSGTLPCR